MASPTQIIIVLACACLVDCRLRGKFNKPPTPLNEHKEIQEANSITFAEHQVDSKIKTNADVVPEAKTIRDEDAIVFPKDSDVKVHLDVNKIIKETSHEIDTNKRNSASTTYVPLLPKVVPAVEAKEVFTNPFVSKDKEKTYKTKDENDKQQKTPNLIQEIKEATVSIDADIIKNNNMKLDNNVTANMSNNTVSSNGTVPDFTSRFGITGNYVLIPANNAQTYQAGQVPNSPVQGNLQQYGTHSGQANTITPLITNAGAYPQYATPNADMQNTVNSQFPQNTDALSPAPVTYNGVSQGTNNVPISVGSTYMINGQLYVAVTLPSNVNVPHSVYLVNSQLPQASGYQSNNNLPVYNSASVGQGDQGNNVNQYVSIN